MLRRCQRAVALALALAACVIHFWFVRIRGPLTLNRRALWLQSACRGVLASLGISVTVEGLVPTRGLVVANHLSYVDIAIFSSVMPCCFVSKQEVIRWPFFGWAARAGGTIFLDRSSRASANAAAVLISDRLSHPVPVLLFPEGTSTDGSQVHRFHGRLIHPATELGAPITAAAVRYVPAGDTPERELCWFGDQEFLPHLFKLLGLEGFTALVRFGEPRVYKDRRTAAAQTRAEVTAMRSEAVLEVASR